MEGVGEGGGDTILTPRSGYSHTNRGWLRCVVITYLMVQQKQNSAFDCLLSGTSHLGEILIQRGTVKGEEGEREEEKEKKIKGRKEREKRRKRRR